MSKFRYFIVFEYTDTSGDWPSYECEGTEVFTTDVELINFLAKEYAGKNPGSNLGRYEDFKLLHVFDLRCDESESFQDAGYDEVANLLKKEEEEKRIKKLKEESMRLDQEMWLARKKEEHEFDLYLKLKEKYGDLE